MKHIIIINALSDFFVRMDFEEGRLITTRNVNEAFKFKSDALAKGFCNDIREKFSGYNPFIIPYLEVNKEGITLKDDVELQKISASLEHYRLAVNFSLGEDLLTSIEYLEDSKNCEWVHIKLRGGGLIEVNVNMDSPSALLSDVQKAITSRGIL